MTGREIRQSFLDFFQQQGHVIVPSAPVVPADDPTLLFTNAGMNQFKPYFLGLAAPPYRRVADTQKCIRVSGKHNDLEEVGHDTYHHTFFEMLGNWSFGDYYKEEAIRWAWQLLTEVWSLPKERLYATVFSGDEELPADEEAARLWTEVTDIEPGHVLRFGRKDNFWMMGDVGPCGPCSEIHMDLTPDASGGRLINAGNPLVMELWNLVFIEFNAEPDGSLRRLPACHVDTGMGLERVAAVMECTQGGRDFRRPISNYDTDLFSPLIRALEEFSGRRYTPGQSTDEDSVAMRVCADHVRMISFSIADGALPSNEGRGYVIRRILRRAARYGRKLGLTEPFLWRLVAVLGQIFGDVFPEILSQRDKVERVVKAEETSFNQTLDRGLALFEQEIERVGQGVFPGEAAFKLYDTYGFPLDLTQVMARERGVEVDVAGFERLMAEQRRRARAAQERVQVLAVSEKLELPPTPFVGYEHLEDEASVLAVLGEGEKLDLVLERTPFYAEMGGQVGDTGYIQAPSGDLEVVDTQRREGVIFHRARLRPGSEPPDPGSLVVAHVDRPRRLAIQRHHTATHLLHQALRDVLGHQVRQQGSLVAPERLRFDFTHFEPVAPGDLAAIERLVNQHVIANHGVSWFEIPFSQKPDNVLAFFGDKYGDRVRVVKIGGQGTGPLSDPVFDGYSMELCGGTHTRHTGEIGLIRIVSEGAIAAGVRRIEALCGQAALDSIERDLQLLSSVSARLGVTPRDLEKRLDALLETQHNLEKELEKYRRQEVAARAEELLSRRQMVGGIPLVVGHLGEADAERLQEVAGHLRGRFQGVVVLGGSTAGKAFLFATVSPEYVARGCHAGSLVRELAREIGGGGGGRPEVAQAGGKDPSRLAAALGRVAELVARQTGG